MFPRNFPSNEFKNHRRKMMAAAVMGGVLFVGLLIVVALGVHECTKKVTEEVSKEDVQQGIAEGVVGTKKFFKEIGEKIKTLEEKETQ